VSLKAETKYYSHTRTETLEIESKHNIQYIEQTVKAKIHIQQFGTFRIHLFIFGIEY